jgi:hypothetical protein
MGTPFIFLSSFRFWFGGFIGCKRRTQRTPDRYNNVEPIWARYSRFDEKLNLALNNEGPEQN